jgi:hypothetical protein
VLYREVTSCSQEAAHHLLTPGAVIPAHAERVVLRSVKRLLHGHVRRLRGLAPALEAMR